MGFGSVNQQVFIQCFLWTRNTVNSAGYRRQRQNVRGKAEKSKLSGTALSTMLNFSSTLQRPSSWSSVPGHLLEPSSAEPGPQSLVACPYSPVWSSPQLFPPLLSPSHFLGKAHQWLSSCQIPYSRPLLPLIKSPALFAVGDFCPGTLATTLFPKTSTSPRTPPSSPLVPAAQLLVFLPFSRPLFP